MIKCPYCTGEFKEEDANKSTLGDYTCPFCDMEIIMMEEKDESKIAEIVSKYGIDQEVVEQIVAWNQDDQLSPFMFIAEDNMICGAKDEAELKHEIMEYIVNDSGSVGEISYIFINGKKVDLEIDISFKES